MFDMLSSKCKERIILSFGVAFAISVVTFSIVMAFGFGGFGVISGYQAFTRFENGLQSECSSALSFEIVCSSTVSIDIDSTPQQRRDAFEIYKRSSSSSSSSSSRRTIKPSCSVCRAIVRANDTTFYMYQNQILYSPHEDDCINFIEMLVTTSTDIFQCLLSTDINHPDALLLSSFDSSTGGTELYTMCVSLAAISGSIIAITIIIVILAMMYKKLFNK